jgi:signal transduction histidine kinase
VGHDVSDRIALEQMREDLTHMIVHDLRNPLGSMMSSLQLIRTALIERDETLPISKLVRIALRSGQKLYLLIDSLLDLRRLESGETELKRTPVAPKALIREAIEQVQPMAMNKEQELSVCVERALPAVTVDREMILRVLTNLLDNAIKFTLKHGHISLSAKCVEAGVRFVVSDTGPGIAPEYHMLIFERFTRLKDTEGLRGTGLGLAFCKLAVEAHGGRIWVESELGQGSNFCVLIPVEEE